MIKGGGTYYENLGRFYLAQLLVYEGKLAAAAEQLESDIATGLENWQRILRWDPALLAGPRVPVARAKETQP